MCSKIIDLYRRFQNQTIADILEKHNKSNAIQLNELEWINPHIDIDNALAPNLTESQAIHLTKDIRGYFIIVNNMEKSIDEYMKHEDPNWVPGSQIFQGDLPPASGITLETKRFKNLMGQSKFFFDVLNWGGLSVTKLKEKINELKTDRNLPDHEAIALMVVTHGEDEEILGFDACDYYNKLVCKQKCNTLTCCYKWKAVRKIEKDRAPIKEIVKLFQDHKFSHLEAKILMFSCCRVKTNPNPVLGVKPVQVNEVKSLANYRDDKLFVCYTCLESNYS